MAQFRLICWGLVQWCRVGQDEGFYTAPHPALSPNGGERKSALRASFGWANMGRDALQLNDKLPIFDYQFSILLGGLRRSYNYQVQ